MENAHDIKAISIIGGTGALGTGLARRWARAGYRIIIGSRNEARARDAATALTAELPNASISGASF